MADPRAVYDALLDAWNRRNADQYAELFEDDGAMVGFDGSQVDGRQAIREHLRHIFGDHPTATYVAKVLEVRTLATDVAMLRAVAGMIPPGGGDIMADRNAVQTLIVRDRVVLFQNTPARYDGRPDLAAALTAELRELLPF